MVLTDLIQNVSADPTKKRCYHVRITLSKDVIHVLLCKALLINNFNDLNPLL